MTDEFHVVNLAQPPFICGVVSGKVHSSDTIFTIHRPSEHPECPDCKEYLDAS